MLQKMHLRSSSAGSGFDRPVDISTSATEQPGLPEGAHRVRPQRKPKIRTRLSTKQLLSFPNVPKFHNEGDAPIPNEMIPVLTLLAAHGTRVYNEGYFMMLAELNNDGQPIANREWVEVFGTLQGTILSMWDANALEEGKAVTSFINFSDGYMRSIESLGSDLENVIVLSTTMKNRYLLQFPTKKLLNEWTAALRLASFERTSLQEAYTGALLSSMGSKLHGIRALLSETRMKTETFCNVRFGVGMPWKRVWAVVIPNDAIKDKKERKRLAPFGKVELYNDPKDVKKKKHPPLAVIHSAFSAYAVFPEKSILVQISSMIKMECTIEIDNDRNIQESAVFIMPEQHPGILGFETLIRFLIPLFDVYALYGRPKRLNADKNDMHSLLFGMPTLPRAYYLDVIDVYMLSALPESQSWSLNDWNVRLKELIARKMTTGYRGTGNIGVNSDGKRSSLLASPSLTQINNKMKRDFSDPSMNFRNFSSSSVNAPTREAPKKPGFEPQTPIIDNQSNQSQSLTPNPEPPLNPLVHQRNASEGQPREPGILSPDLNESDEFKPNGDGDPEEFTFRPSHNSYADYSEYMKQYINRQSMAPNNAAKEGIEMEESGSEDEHEHEHEHEQPAKRDSDLYSDSDSSINVPVAGMDLNKKPVVQENDWDRNSDEFADSLSVPSKIKTNETNERPHTPNSVGSGGAVSSPGPKIGAYPNAPGGARTAVNRSPNRKPSGPRPEAGTISSAVNNIGNQSNSEIWDSESQDAEANSDNWSDSYSRLDSVPTYKPTPVKVNPGHPDVQPLAQQQAPAPAPVQHPAQGTPQQAHQFNPYAQQPVQGYQQPQQYSQQVPPHPQQYPQQYPVYGQQMPPMGQPYQPYQPYAQPQAAQAVQVVPMQGQPVQYYNAGNGQFRPQQQQQPRPAVNAPMPGGPRFPQHVNRGGSAKTGPVLKPVKDLKSKRAELMGGDFGI